MVFSSLIFLFRFMPLFFICYYLIPNKYKNICLLIFSLLFYSWGEAKYILLMISSIIVDYFASRAIDRSRDNKVLKSLFLGISISFNIGILFVFKYYNFMIGSVNDVLNINIPLSTMALPLGISFYTFQTLSYTIDVYLGKIKCEKNIINFGAFVTMFPQLIAGPIVKYTDIKNDISSRKFNAELVQEGVEEFIIGLGKKVLLANNLGMLWEEAQTIGFSNISTPMAWLSILSFALQIYYDFSGYSSMAIGLGKMLGFRFPINFNFPYISRSMTEFWRRWHITLGSWFKEYVYIPLGGNRRGKSRTYLNLFIVWLLTGLWHGAEFNFVIWGLYFFIIILIEKAILLRFLDKHKIFSHIYAIITILIGWAIFAITDLSYLNIFIQRLFVFSYNSEWLYYLKNYLIIIAIGVICCTPGITFLWVKLKKNQFIKTALLMILFIISISYLVDASYNPFLYFRF